MRALIFVAVLLALGACKRADEGYVQSRTPLFAAIDGNGAPGFRSGVWLRKTWWDAPETCAFGQGSDARKWPPCVEWTIVAAGRMVRADGVAPDGAPRRKSYPYLLAAGHPLIEQDGGGGDPGRYFYFTVTNLQLDKAGMIIAARVIPVGCRGAHNPEDDEPASDEVGASGSAAESAPAADVPTTPVKLSVRNILSGLRKIKDDCVPRGRDGLINAAQIDAQGENGPANFIWIRDGDH
jgi:hypothetical protein